MIGVRADGTKELIAMADGYRESAESWADLLRDCARRGMRAPVLAIGDGALGFWKALREVFPATREQRCWVHKTDNVHDSMPKAAQPAAQKALQDIYSAEDRDHAEQAVKTVTKLYGANFPKAIKKITDDQDELLAFCDFPAEHWIHLRTTNPIESNFATVRPRTKVTKGAGSRAAGLAMVFKLVESAQHRWRGERTSPGRPGPGRSPLRTRKVCRTPRAGGSVTNQGQDHFDRGSTDESVAERYIRLCLQLGRHGDGVVDTYFGPPELKAAVDAEPLCEPREVAASAETLLAGLSDGWLRDQATALRTHAGVLATRPGRMQTRQRVATARVRCTPTRRSSSTHTSGWQSCCLALGPSQSGTNDGGNRSWCRRNGSRLCLPR
jgi:mutator family transposase